MNRGEKKNRTFLKRKVEETKKFILRRAEEKEKGWSMDP